MQSEWKKLGVFSNILTGKQEINLQKDLGVDGKTTLEKILNKWVSIRGIGLIRFKTGKFL